jgi:hypothetical protein
VGRWVFQILVYGFLFLLLLCVAGREIPEISKLADDPSNDGQQAVSRTEALPSPTPRRLDVAEVGASFGNRQPCFEAQRQHEPEYYPSVALAITGRDLLSLLAVRRT